MYSKPSIAGAIISPRARYYRRGIHNYFQENISLVCFGILYLIGAFIGVEIVQGSAIKLETGLLAIFKGFLETRASQPIADTVISSFLSTFYIVAILFVLGFCAISAPIIPLFSVFKGVGYGITAATMLQSVYRDKLPQMLMLILPYSVAAAIIVIISSKYAMKMSIFCYRVFKDGGGAPKITAGEYCRIFALLTFLVAVFALMDGSLYAYFSPSLFI